VEGGRRGFVRPCQYVAEEHGHTGHHHVARDEAQAHHVGAYTPALLSSPEPFLSVA